MGGVVKPNIIMDTLNQISTLTGALDSLTRAGEKEAAKEVAAKILELVKKL